MPVPLLDDLLMRQTRRRLVRDAAARHHVTLGPAEVAVLSQTRERSFWGCIGFAASLLVRLPLRFLRRLLRTVLFFLAARDATSAATRLFHESVLLELGLASWSAVPASPPGAAAAPRARRLRVAIDRTWLEVDPRPIRRTVRATLAESWSLLRSSARALGRKARRLLRRSAAEGDQEVDLAGALPDSLLDRLATALSHEGAYLRDLGERFRRHWPPPGAEAGSSGDSRSDLH